MTREEKVNVFEDYCRSVESCDACTLEALGYCKIDNLRWTDAMVDIVYNRITADKVDEAHERFMNIGDAEVESKVENMVNPNATQIYDTVNHPAHYTKGGIECIDAIRASMTKEAFAGYCKGNVIKYVFRYEQKGGKESLEKAKVYLDWLIAATKGESK